MSERIKTGGRKAGTPNRMPSALRQLILGALDDAGGQAYLARQAIENPCAFMALLGKCLPKEIKAEVAMAHVVARLTPEELRGIAEAILGDSHGGMHQPGRPAH